jgi:hypothetical protein
MIIGHVTCRAKEAVYGTGPNNYIQKPTFQQLVKAHKICRIFTYTLGYYHAGCLQRPEPSASGFVPKLISSISCIILTSAHRRVSRFSDRSVCQLAHAFEFVGLQLLTIPSIW